MAQPQPATDVAPSELTAATGAGLRDAFLASSSWLDSQVERINALNVFPVPDGDTGINMSLTLRAAADEIRRLPDSATAGEVARSAYNGAMLGARGNSGVILSQLLRGFAHALTGHEQMTTADLAEALCQASEVAYGAVSRPTEGTILTVARKVGEAAASESKTNQNMSQVLERIVTAAAIAVAETPRELEVLRKAGVVDSGGEGYRVMLEGVWMWMTGQSVEQAIAAGGPAIVLPQLDAISADGDHGGFGFCTEFLLHGCLEPATTVRGTMESLGDSVIAVGDGSLMRVHVHTLRPGQVLEWAVERGTLTKVKVENMTVQNAEFTSGLGRREVPSEALTEGIGVVAVAAGEGLSNVLRSMGAVVVEGGQTMNPSVQELLAAALSTQRTQVIILPNNKNILMTASHVTDLTPHTVEVVPTESVIEGIAALLAFNFEGDLTGNVSSMTASAGTTHTLEITHAVRDAEVDGVTVRTGQAMAIYDGHVVAAATDEAEAAIAALAHAPDRVKLMTIYYGEGASLGDAEQLADRIRSSVPEAEIEVVDGGQPHYPYLLSIE